MESIYNYTLEELQKYFLSIGSKKFVANQIYDWIYKKRINTFEEMTNIKLEIRNQIKKDIFFDLITIEEIKKGQDVKKFLFKLLDGNYIEAVLMFHDYGNSLCVSTQVGCNMGCSFCESGRRKKVRNLYSYEMVEQILLIEKEENIKVSHIVLMGIGEPFDNYKNVLNFIKIINDPKGLEIGARHITISTCGIIPKIKEFMDIKIQVNLAISLHASNNELRNRLMPINKVYDLNSLMKIVKEYIKVTNRRVTMEYILLDGINDNKENAIELVNLLKGINCYVNLIPYNETSHIEYKRSGKNRVLEFYDTLKKNNINVTIRKEFGSLIDGACGQLRSKKEEIL